MTTQISLLGELEAAIQSGSSAKRTEMLRRVTDLFVVTAPSVTPQQAGVFDDVFEQLIKEIEWKAKVELSDRVSPLGNAPDRLIRHLAHDDSIEISGPVLAKSPRLGEEELVAIARTKSQAHLAAIAGRPDIGEQVTDVLVERGDMTVARKVAANNGARFSEGSLRNLVDRATDDGDLASAVARRRELPAPMFRQLLTKATDAVRQKLLESAQPEYAGGDQPHPLRGVADRRGNGRTEARLQRRQTARERDEAAGRRRGREPDAARTRGKA